MHLVALDIGYGFVKAATLQGQVAFHSVIGPGTDMPTFGMQGGSPVKADAMVIEADGQSYFVGKMAIRRSKAPVRPLARDRGAGQGAKALIMAAFALLREVGYLPIDGAPLLVVSGTPPGWAQQASSLERSLVGQHSFVSRIAGRPQRHDINVRDVAVLPQSLGAFWHHVMAADADDTTFVEGRVGVIDTGFRTVDLAMVGDGEYIPEGSHTLDFGFGRVADELSRWILDSHGLSIPSYALDDVLISASVRVAGEDVSVAEQREHLIDEFAECVAIELASRWQVLEMDAFLLAGGPARVLLPSLQDKLGRCHVVRDAGMANAMGYLHYGSQRFADALEMAGHSKSRLVD